MEQDIKLIKNKDAKFGFTHIKIIGMTHWLEKWVTYNLHVRAEVKKDKPESPEVPERVL